MMKNDPIMDLRSQYFNTLIIIIKNQKIKVIDGCSVSSTQNSLGKWLGKLPTHSFPLCFGTLFSYHFYNLKPKIYIFIYLKINKNEKVERKNPNQSHWLPNLRAASYLAQKIFAGPPLKPCYPESRPFIPSRLQSHIIKR